MKHNFHAGITEGPSQRLQAGDRQWIHHGRLTPGGELQQIDPVVETVEAGRFGIHRQKRLPAESLEQTLQLRLTLNQTNTHVNPPSPPAPGRRQSHREPWTASCRNPRRVEVFHPWPRPSGACGPIEQRGGCSRWLVSWWAGRE